MPVNQQTKPDNISALRKTALGEVRYGEIQTGITHTALQFFLKVVFVLNVGSWLGLWSLFRLKSLFPPHDAPFMTAVGWYFFFGGLFAVFAFFSFKFARFIEHQAVTQALAQNRRYEWHTRYDTKNMSEEELKKIPEAQKNKPAGPAVDPGGNYFRLSTLLIVAAFAAWGFGAFVFFADLI
jgi:hypothetical protein